MRIEDMNNDELMDEEQIIILQRLLGIGTCDDYYGKVKVKLLEQISLLPILSPSMINYLENDVVNVGRDSMSFFQPETNDTLRYLVSKYQKYRVNSPYLYVS